MDEIVIKKIVMHQQITECIDIQNKKFDTDDLLKEQSK